MNLGLIGPTDGIQMAKPMFSPIAQMLTNTLIGPILQIPFVPWILDEPHAFESDYGGNTPPATYFERPDVLGDIIEQGDLPPR